MRRSLAGAFVLIATTAVAASAASQPSGTIECRIAPTDPINLFFTSPFLSSVPSTRSIGIKSHLAGTCDDTGVTGGKAPITNVEIALRGRLETGSTCASLVNAPAFAKLKLQIKWRNLGADGHLRTVATSRPHLLAGSWDDGSESLVFTSTLFKGGFAGSPATLRLVITHPEEFEVPGCPPHSGANVGSTSTITVP